MAIVPLEKITLFGLKSQQPEVLDGLQRLGCIHLVSLNPAVREHPISFATTAAHQALAYLEQAPQHRKPPRHEHQFDFDRVVQETLALQNREEQLCDELVELQEAIAAKEPWGDFALPNKEALAGLQIWFYLVQRDRLSEWQHLPLVWQLIKAEAQLARVVVVAEQEPIGVPGTRLSIDPRSLDELDQRLEEAEAALQQLAWQRQALTRWLPALRRQLDDADDRALRDAAGQWIYAENELFALQGWAPRKLRPTLLEFAKQHRLAWLIEPASDEQQPPTLLENPEVIGGGEQAVTFYTTPSYFSWDPSLVVLASFALFFAMIFADAGYGFLLGIITLFSWRKLGSSAEARRFRWLLAYLSLACILYGVLSGSYFGLSPEKIALLQPLQQFVVFSAIDQNFMMFLSITIGVFHLALANLIMAWNYRYFQRRFVYVGWAAVFVGCWLAGVGYQRGLPGQTLVWWGWWLAGLGLASAILFSSNRPWNSPKQILLRLLTGLNELPNITKAFGDALSYLRLFALGLAGSQLAITLNGLAEQVAPLWSGVGVLVAVLILLFGHSLNFILAIMGGVVHGLRLNFIEFFGWCLPDEGHPFRAFRKKGTTPA